MPSEIRLLTFVHISDLHFGDPDPGSSNALLGAHAQNWWRIHRTFDGYLGHSGIALRHLDQRFGQLKRDEDASLFVTGDLTAVGSVSQFNTATTYLTRSVPLPSGHSVGLSESAALKFAIPGNHDHWPGMTALSPIDPVMFGHATAGLLNVFPSLAPQPNSPPFPMSVRSLKPGVDLVILGIDTDAEVGPYGPSRFLARGKFVGQLQSLHTVLNARPAPNDIRVLLLHHSPQNNATTLGLTKNSRRALDQFVSLNQISVLLTGHMHTGVFSDIEPKLRWSFLDCSRSSMWNNYATRFPPHRLASSESASSSEHVVGA